MNAFQGSVIRTSLSEEDEAKRILLFGHHEES
jgi:hypothetical protein